MSIENSTIKDTPEKIKYVQEQKENFTDAEQKLIDDFSKNTGYEKIDPLNMDAETKKT